MKSKNDQLQTLHERRIQRFGVVLRWAQRFFTGGTTAILIFVVFAITTASYNNNLVNFVRWIMSVLLIGGIIASMGALLLLVSVGALQIWEIAIYRIKARGSQPSAKKNKKHSD